MSDRDWNDAWRGALFVGGFAVFCRFLAWSAALSIKAILKRPEINPNKVAETAFNACGSLAIIGTFLYLAITR
jgi:hypothetical protein